MGGTSDREALRRPCWRRRLVAVAAIALSALAMAGVFRPSIAQAIPYHWDQLTENALPECVPVVDTGRVAWIGQDQSGWGIYVYDPLWGSARKISSEGDDWGSLTLAGDLVVWGTHIPGPYAIKLEHIPSGEERTLALPAGDIGTIVTDGRYVVWTDQGAGPGDVFLYDFTTGQTVQLTDDALNEYACKVDDGYVVWERESASDPAGRVDVLSYDTRTAQTTVLTTYALRYRNLALDAGRVAWLQHDYNHVDIFLYDLASGSGKIVVATPTNKSFVELHGDKLTWSDGWNETSEICVVDLDQPTPAIPHTLNINTVADVFPQTDGRFVAWDDRPDSGDQVHVYDTVTSGMHMFQGYMSGVDGFSRGRLAWSSGTWPNTEVWTATLALFDDVVMGPYYEAIQGMAERGLIAGYPRADGGADFRPDNDVLRAQFAKMICGALELPVSEDAGLPPFTDLGWDDPNSLYPHEYVAAAYDAGITTGTSATTFSPYLSISRAQAVTMAYRGVQQLYPGLLAAPPSGYLGSLGNFSSTHQEAMQALEFNGVLANLQGFGSAWDPWANASRAELAEVLWQVMRKIAATWGQ